MTSEEWKKKLEQYIEKHPEFTKEYLLLNQELEEELNRIDEQAQKQSYHPKGIEAKPYQEQKRAEFFSRMNKIRPDALTKEAKELSKDISEPAEQTNGQITQATNEVTTIENGKKELDTTNDSSHAHDPTDGNTEAKIQQEGEAERIKQQRIQEIIKRAEEMRERIKKEREGFER